jgi:hypothetical protein
MARIDCGEDFRRAMADVFKVDGEPVSFTRDELSELLLEVAGKTARAIGGILPTLTPDDDSAVAETEVQFRATASALRWFSAGDNVAEIMKNEHGFQAWISSFSEPRRRVS